MMGIDMVVLLIDYNALQELLSLTTSELIGKLESSTLARPTADPEMERQFDIDAGAEILDFLETGELESPEGMLLLARWSAIGEWEAWEGRTFIYIETLLGREVEHVDELYEPEIWLELIENISTFTKKEYSNAVVMDWMQRREKLGESLDEKSDPHILPTMEAHQRNAEGLFHVLQMAKKEGISLLLGREHMPASKWLLDGKKLKVVEN